MTRRALLEKRPFRNTPKKIDYVSPHGDLTIVNEKFDIVFSSHSIEHQMNLIKHLQLVENILNDGGLYVMIVPDKRYCFDHFRAETSVTQLLDSYVRDIEFRPLFDFLDASMVRTHSYAFRHWLGDHGNFNEKATPENFKKLREFYETARTSDTYIDAHSLCLTPRSFARLIELINRIGLTTFQVHRLCHTVWGRFEFSIVLKKAD